MSDLEKESFDTIKTKQISTNLSDKQYREQFRIEVKISGFKLDEHMKKNKEKEEEKKLNETINIFFQQSLNKKEEFDKNSTLILNNSKETKKFLECCFKELNKDGQTDDKTNKIIGFIKTIYDNTYNYCSKYSVLTVKSFIGKKLEKENLIEKYKDNEIIKKILQESKSRTGTV